MTMTEDTTTTSVGSAAPATLEEIEAKLFDLDEQIVKFPDYDPRGTALLKQKQDLLRQRDRLQA